MSTVANPATLAHLRSANPKDRVIALHALIGAPDPTLADVVESLLTDTATTIVSLPIRYGEVRVMAAQALAAIRSVLNDDRPVVLERGYPALTATELGPLVRRASEDLSALDAAARYAWVRDHGILEPERLEFYPQVYAPLEPVVEAPALSDPLSLAERRALAATWQRDNDPRATLIRLQLELHALDDRDCPEVRAIRLAITAELCHRAAWAGPIHGLVSSYSFVLGLVGRIELSVNEFARIGPQIVAAAPILYANLTAPATRWAAAVALPAFGKIQAIGAWNLGIDDEGAIALANSPSAAGLRWIDLGENRIGRKGVEALAASPYLAQAVFVGLNNNLDNPAPTAVDFDGTRVVMKSAAADELQRRYGARPWLAGVDDPDAWPPASIVFH